MAPVALPVGGLPLKLLELCNPGVLLGYFSEHNSKHKSIFKLIVNTSSWLVTLKHWCRLLSNTDRTYWTIAHTFMSFMCLITIEFHLNSSGLIEKFILCHTGKDFSILILDICIIKHTSDYKVCKFHLKYH